MEKSGQILNMGLDWAPCQLSRGQKETGPRSRVGGAGQEERGLDRMPKAHTPNLPSFRDLPLHSADHLVPVSKSSAPRSGPTGGTKRPVCLRLRGFPGQRTFIAGDPTPKIHVGRGGQQPWEVAWEV